LGKTIRINRWAKEVPAPERIFIKQTSHLVRVSKEPTAPARVFMMKECAVRAPRHPGGEPMRKLALATAAAAALMFSAPAFTTPALAQADVKVKINSGDGDHMRKKVVIRRGGDMERRRHGDMERRKVVIRSGDRGRHEGWRHRDSGMTKKVIIKRGEGGSKTVIKKFD
jgi:hypothetical protein